MVHDQEDTLSEQGEAIENDVVIEEQVEQAHNELTKKRKLKNLTKFLEESKPQENCSFVYQNTKIE